MWYEGLRVLEWSLNPTTHPDAGPVGLAGVSVEASKGVQGKGLFWGGEIPHVTANLLSGVVFFQWVYDNRRIEPA